MLIFWLRDEAGPRPVRKIKIVSKAGTCQTDELDRFGDVSETGNPARRSQKHGGLAV